MGLVYIIVGVFVEIRASRLDSRVYPQKGKPHQQTSNGLLLLMAQFGKKILYLNDRQQQTSRNHLALDSNLVAIPHHQNADLLFLKTYCLH